MAKSTTTGDGAGRSPPPPESAREGGSEASRLGGERLGRALGLTGVGVWEWRLDDGETWWSPAVYQLWGVPAGEHPPPLAQRPIHPDDRNRYEAALAAARDAGELKGEWRVAAPGRPVRWLACVGVVERADGGARMLGVTWDITHTRQNEARLKLQVRELQHRVRNIFGVLRSVVARSVRNAASLEELASHLDGRIEALARAQAISTRADGSVDLEDLVREGLLSVAAREDQMVVEGPPIRLRREMGEIFALALHELATNAVKYGALSRQAGRISVRWRVADAETGPRLALEWRESGASVVSVRPTRAGFGRELIEKVLPSELGATTSLEFVRGGARALIEMPLAGGAVLDGPEEERRPES